MVVDTSIIVAIARRESDAFVYSKMLEQTPGKLMAAPTYLECAFVMAGVAPTKGMAFLQGLVSDTLITVVSFGERELDVAIKARLKFSRGSGHPALPLLFKGDDFIHTDIEPALKPA
jgi:ribonuclease VapC